MQFKKEWVVPTAIGAGSFIVGVVGGYFLAHVKPLKTLRDIHDEINIRQQDLIALNKMTQKSKAKLNEYEERLEAAKQEANEDQLQLDLEHHEEDDEVIIIEHETKFAKIEAQKQAVMADVEEETMVNVFRVEDDDWDWDVEMEKRKQRPDRPYIIHRDEYFNEERADEGFTQSTVTYYGGDGILCDESDVPIYEAEQIVGKLEFGRGSGDPNVCYVRNERLLIDYEVLLEPGWFGAEVLGQHVQDLIEKSKKAKLEHSVPKFRPE